MTNVPAIALNDGATIPQLGFGVFQIEPDETAAAVKTALDIGYRHIDTAEMYGNERGVGQGIRDAGVDRAEVYVTSKLNNGFHRPDDARRAFEKTLDGARVRLRRPVPHPLAAADPVRRRFRVHLARRSRSSRATAARAASACPTSRPAHLQRLADETETTPAVNQIEVHPYFTNDEVRAYGEHTGSPPRRGRRSRRAACSAIRW